MGLRRFNFVLFSVALTGLSTLPAAGQCNTSTNCTGQGTSLSVAAGAPFPDTGEAWTHSAGSQAHCNPTSGWYADCWALDLNYNPTGLFNLDYLMPVLATADGTVDMVQYSGSGYGNLVRINHNNQFQSLYAHMDPILMVFQNQPVRAGQVLGFISNSGVSAHHLHFALRTSAGLAAYTQLQGNPGGNQMTDAPSTSLSFLSGANQLFFDDFRAQNPGWGVTPANGILSLPAGDVVRPFTHYLHVRSGKGPYLFEHAVQFDPYVTAGTVQLQLQAFSLGQHPNIGGTAARTQLGTRFSALTSSTNQGWEVASYRFPYTNFPPNTRFVRPAIATAGGYAGGAKLNWVRFVELSPNDLSIGGNVRLKGFNRGGANRLEWSLSDATGVSQLRVLRANSELGTYTDLTPAGLAPATIFHKDNTVIPGAIYYYKLEIRNAGGFARTVGPIGPLETSLRHQIPGLGDTRISSNMRDVPDWAGYPALSFDGNNDTYGLINYNASQVQITFTPVSAPRTLTKIRAYFGGNTNNWGGSLVQYGTGQTVVLPSASNTSLQWSEIAIPAVPIQSITLWFQRTNGDRFFHNAELVFVP